MIKVNLSYIPQHTYLYVFCVDLKFKVRFDHNSNEVKCSEKKPSFEYTPNEGIALS